MNVCAFFRFAQIPPLTRCGRKVDDRPIGRHGRLDQSPYQRSESGVLTVPSGRTCPGSFSYPRSSYLLRWMISTPCPGFNRLGAGGDGFSDVVPPTPFEHSNNTGSLHFIPSCSFQKKNLFENRSGFRKHLQISRPFLINTLFPPPLQSRPYA